MGGISLCFGIDKHSQLSHNALQVPYYRQETIEFEVQPTEIAFTVQNDTVNIKVNDNSSSKTGCYMLLALFSPHLKYKAFQ